MRSLLFDLYETTRVKVLSGPLRALGKRMYLAGLKLEGDNASQDRLVPSLRNIPYAGSQPDLQAADFIAPNSTILGKVNVGFNSSVWYGATLIGTKSITIGDNSVVQDKSHLSSQVTIGNNVFVGPNVILQGATLADNSYVAMGATVRHAKVQTGGLVAAGAVISDNIIVKQGQIWAGNPGKFLRNITPIERQILNEHLQQMRDLALIHADQTQRNPRQVISGKRQPFETQHFDEQLSKAFTEEQDYNKLNLLSELDEQFIQRRIMMRQQMHAPHSKEEYQPYQFNVSHMGQKFNLGVHNQAYTKVATKLNQKQKFQQDNNPWVKPF